MDFGIARLQSAEFTGSGAIVGTPSYMAPEQITNGAIGPATDLFAVGCLLYELLGYHKPFEAETIHGVLYQVLTTDPPALRTMAPSIRAALERVATKAMNKVPEDRYDSAQQMQSALVAIRAALSGAGQTTERLGPRWTPLPAPVLRLISHAPMRWRVVVLASLALVVALLVSRSSGPPSLVAPLPPPPATLEQLIAEPLPGRHLAGASGITIQHDGLPAREDCGARRRAGGSHRRRGAAQSPAHRPPGGDRCAAARPRAGGGERARGEPPRPHEPVDGAAEHDGMGGLFSAPHAPRRQLPGAAVLGPRDDGAGAGAGRIQLCAGGRGRSAPRPAAAGDELHEDVRGLAHRRRALRGQLPLKGAALLRPYISPGPLGRRRRRRDGHRVGSRRRGSDASQRDGLLEIAARD